MKKLLLLFILCLQVIVLSGQLSNELKLSSGNQTPSRNLEAYLSRAADVEPQDVVAGVYYRLVQFESMPDRTEINELKSNGFHLLQYIPNKAYLVSIDVDFQIQTLRRFDLRHISAIPDFLKIDQALQSENYPAHIIKGNDLELHITYPKAIDQNYVLEYLRTMGIAALEYNGYNPAILIQVPRSKLSELYATPFLFRIDPGPQPATPDDTGGKTLARANLLDSNLPTGRHYNGAGISVLCRDDGDVGPHIDFKGRLNQEIESSPFATHADLVSGVMCGAANLNPDIPGMATEAELFVINYRANFLDNTMDLHFDENVLVTNSSYSDGCNDGYTGRTRTVDDQCYDNPTLMHVFSSGNSNGQSCGYGAGDQWANITGGHKQGKNVITVGSTNSQGQIANSSSRGPAYDGRIKPDLTAHGQGHTSTLNNNAYRTTSGTSFSAPLVSGVTAMLHQAYKDNNNQEVADAALLKTLMLNTANDLGSKGPDFIFGWGSVNAFRAVVALEEKRYETAQLGIGEINEHQITIPAATSETRVMVYWKDPASQPGVSQALINDLDAKIVGPGGNEFFPYVLNTDPDPNLLRQPATTGIDGLNNMEQITIQNPNAGTYTLEVMGNIIPMGVHEYFVTWEHITDNHMITYPAGGEKLQPGNVLRVHWDAVSMDDTYTMEYSTDNGNEWIAIPGNSTRHFREFALPSILTDQARVKVIKGTQEVISEPFTIAPVPRKLLINKVCIDLVELNWDSTESAMSYDIYKLGERRMEFIGTTMDTFYNADITNPFEEEWFAVSANFENDIKSQRSIAIGTDAEGLINCKLDRDLELGALNLTNGGNYIVCEGPLVENISIDIINDGEQPLNDFDVNYSVNGVTIASENILQTLQPEDTLIHTFATPYEFTDNSDYEIVSWLSRNGERLTQNDTLSRIVEAYLDQGVALNFEEDFNSSNEIPRFWFVGSEDDIRWDIIPAVQINGRLDNVCVMPLSRNTGAGTEDFLNTHPLDFSTVTGEVALHFDLAYKYDDRNDGLIVRVLGECGMAVMDTLYEKYGEELNSSFEFFDVPEERADWMSEVIDLSAYAGMDKVIIQFVGISQRGSDLFLDNINISTVESAAPKSDFAIISSNQPCVLEEIFLDNESTGEILDESWNFGFGGIPSSSEQNGPHSLSYLFSGEKNITLTVMNDLGQNSMTKQINIYDKPSGGWTSEELGLAQVQFNSNFDLANFYSWNFGDGSSSNVSDPLHQYAQPGIYEVSLTVRNDCGQKVLVDEIVVMTSSVEETEESSENQTYIYPNPNNGSFQIAFSSAERQAMELRNVEGKRVDEMATITQYESAIHVTGLAAGVYFVTLSNGKRSETLRVVVVE